MTGGLTAAQVAFLLRPVRPDRVHRDPGGNSYLPQQDIRAHLTRIFGFGNWSTDVTETVMVFEEPTRTLDKTTKKPKPDRFDALYRATVRLTVCDQHGAELAHYEDTATGDAQNQTHLAAHDLALKSAVSTALKRAATCLGDQFGLSLYNKGSLSAFVVGSLIAPDGGGDGDERVNEAPVATEEEPQSDEPETHGYDGDAAGASPGPSGATGLQQSVDQHAANLSQSAYDAAEREGQPSGPTISQQVTSLRKIAKRMQPSATDAERDRFIFAAMEARDLQRTSADDLGVLIDDWNGVQR